MAVRPVIPPRIWTQPYPRLRQQGAERHKKPAKTMTCWNSARALHCSRHRSVPLRGTAGCRPGPYRGTLKNANHMVPRDCSYEPPPELVQHAIRVYKRAIHLQPLPLLEGPDMAEHLKHAPHFLSWSLISLALSIEQPDLHDLDLETMNQQVAYSRSIVRRLTAQGLPRADLVQSLCLLAMKDIIGTRPLEISSFDLGLRKFL